MSILIVYWPFLSMVARDCKVPDLELVPVRGLVLLAGICGRYLLMEVTSAMIRLPSVGKKSIPRGFHRFLTMQPMSL